MRGGCSRRRKARVSRRGEKNCRSGHKPLGLYFLLTLSRSNNAWADAKTR